ncbi:ciliogenesis and planar polarity effector 2 isoform X1 [Sphaerodactylus townsendi]|uniref:ciliogenesis and planar polarity effector 2 isoform X1 n=1 Tax=Sphaerodactylus townsendi TaxID=933632 RepID=UPI002025FB81|nr:ciliogenesis and planar polarity effector 2 isoform X1 [Sphaerodactylus townsendi]
MLVPHGCVVDPDWHKSPEAERYLGAALRRNQRGPWGLLERPVLSPQEAADVVSYKVFVSGRSAVGKTALVASLGGLQVPSAHHETTGIQTTSVYWPAKLRESGRPLFFKFTFWDCGGSVVKKFDHILPVSEGAVGLLGPGRGSQLHREETGVRGLSHEGPVLPSNSQACIEKVDGFLLLFSFTDRASFDDLPSQISRVAEGAKNAVRIVIGTKFDQFAHTDVTEHDVAAFHRSWGLPVLRAKSINAPGSHAGLSNVAHLLNGLAEHLWRQDQQAAGLLPPSASPKDSAAGAGGTAHHA